MYPYDDVDHDCKAIGMDYGIYPGLWYARSRGCEIFNAHILHDDVAVPFCLSVFMIRIVGVGAMGVWIGMFSDWTLRGIIFRGDSTAESG